MKIKNLLIYYNCNCAKNISIPFETYDNYYLDYYKKLDCYECIFKKAQEHSFEMCLPHLYGSKQQIKYGTVCRYSLTKNLKRGNIPFHSETDPVFWIENFTKQNQPVI